MTLTRGDIDVLTKHSGPFVITGYMKTKHTTWHSRCINTASGFLHQHMEAVNSYMVCTQGSSTFYAYNASHQFDVLNIVLVDLPEWIRVGGRLTNTKISYAHKHKHSILLLSKHQLTDFLFFTLFSWKLQSRILFKQLWKDNFGFYRLKTRSILDYKNVPYIFAPNLKTVKQRWWILH